VTAYDTGTNTAVTVPVGDIPYGLAVTPDCSEVYVANANSNTVSVISIATDMVTATIAVGDDPLEVAITPDGSAVYVTK